jgi:hypothetical protein
MTTSHKFTTTTTTTTKTKTTSTIMVQRQSPNTAAVAFLLVLANHLASCHAAEFGDAGRPFWIAHGSLMLLAWGVVFPLGALLAVFRKNVGEGGNVFTKYQSFYPPHLYFQCFGVLLNIIAVILAARGNYLEYETGNPFDEVLWDFTSPLYPWNHHVKWGVSVLIILVSEVCIFFTRFRDFSPLTKCHCFLFY